MPSIQYLDWIAQLNGGCQAVNDQNHNISPPRSDPDGPDDADQHDGLAHSPEPPSGQLPDPQFPEIHGNAAASEDSVAPENHNTSQRAPKLDSDSESDSEFQTQTPASQLTPRPNLESILEPQQEPQQETAHDPAAVNPTPVDSTDSSSAGDSSSWGDLAGSGDLAGLGNSMHSVDPMISAAMDLDDPALRKEIEATLAKHGYTSEHLAKQSSGKRGSSDRAASRRKRARRAAPKSPLPRELVLAWCLWLLGGLMVTWAMDMPAAEMIRWMVIGSLIGMMLLWPTFRLSQSPGGLENPPDEKTSGNVPNPASDPAQDTLITPMVILRDWFFLILVFQAVIWPLRLTAQWSILQTVWLDAAVAAWTLLSAVLIAWGCLSNRGRDRTLAMVLCLLLLFGEPIAMWLVNLGASPPGAPHYSWTMRISPFETVWTLTHLTAVNVSRPSQIGWLLWPLSLPVLVVAATALLGWVIVGLAGIRSGRAVRLRLGSTVPESSAAN